MARYSRPESVGDLRASGYRPVPVRAEMRRNLLAMMRQGRDVFPGIVGFDDTVIPRIEDAIIAGHDVIFLGERGQAKSRVMRSLVNLLDEEIPVVKGCEINDDPFAPICKYCRNKSEEMGDSLEIDWLPRTHRYVEKLATPDTTIADLIGDIDPIKVAEGRYLSDELTMHYGLIPRGHRGIFAINELPDLAERLQVGLFNLMEERDIQVRGYNIRLPLDIFLVASANPEDYTSRGRIVTPLKDRFGAQVRTHYPRTIQDEITIVEAERRRFPEDGFQSYVPTFMKEILMEVTHLARQSHEINQSSGVSVRVSIANYETLTGNAIRRAVMLHEDFAVPRITDLPSICSSAGVKIEMEGFDDANEDKVIEGLIEKAVLSVFNRYYQTDSLQSVVDAFSEGVAAEASDLMPSRSYMDLAARLAGLEQAARVLAADGRPEAMASAVEFVLEGLYVNRKIQKTKGAGRYSYGR
jgi:magnesium chelatase subunit I